MIRFLLGAFMVTHGLVTASIAQPRQGRCTFRATIPGWSATPDRGRRHRPGRRRCFALAGIGFITHQAWWRHRDQRRRAALLLRTLFFNPWLLAGITISAGILYAGIQALPQA